VTSTASSQIVRRASEGSLWLTARVTVAIALSSSARRRMESSCARRPVTLRTVLTKAVLPSPSRADAAVTDAGKRTPSPRMSVSSNSLPPAATTRRRMSSISSWSSGGQKG
jgi:hypothetical protein